MPARRYARSASRVMTQVQIDQDPLDLPGRPADLDHLLSLARSGGAGRTVFVVGGPGDGRTGLLRRFARNARRATVVGGDFAHGHYVPWDDHARSPADVLRVLEQVVSLVEPLVPFATLIGEMMATAMPLAGSYRVCSVRGSTRLCSRRGWCVRFARSAQPSALSMLLTRRPVAGGLTSFWCSRARLVAASR